MCICICVDRSSSSGREFCVFFSLFQWSTYCRRTVRSSKYMVFDRKSIPIVAWYVLSKLSYIKRVIRDVFPTLCSPKNTNLNFRNGFPKSPLVDIFCLSYAFFRFVYLLHTESWYFGEFFSFVVVVLVATLSVSLSLPFSFALPFSLFSFLFSGDSSKFKPNQNKLKKKNNKKTRRTHSRTHNLFSFFYFSVFLW